MRVSYHAALRLRPVAQLKPGELITGIGYQYSDGQKIIRLERVVFADGKEMLLYGH